MKPRRIPHRGFAQRHIRMHRERRLDIGEGRDDDAPDALDGVERQDAAMALHQPAHHVGLARRTERRADLLGLLDRISRSMMSPRAISRRWTCSSIRVDLFAQHLKRGRSGGRFGHLRNLTNHPSRLAARSGCLRRISKDEEPVLSHGLRRRKDASSLAHAASATQTRLNPMPVLTKSPPGTSFYPFRGHLSRPACSHVKQLAKQAGDNVIPAEPIVQAGFFYGLISGGS